MPRRVPGVCRSWGPRERRDRCGRKRRRGLCPVRVDERADGGRRIGRDHSGRNRGNRSEGLCVDPCRVQAAVHECFCHVVHEPHRTADVGVCVRREFKVLEQLSGEPTGGGVVVAETVVVARAAVGDMPSAGRKAGQQGACFVGERMLRAVPSSVDPPHRASIKVVGQRMEHREHRSGPDAGGDQHDGCLVSGKGECASRGSHIQDVVDRDVLMQVTAAHSMGFLFDTDPVLRVSGTTGQGIAANNRRALRVGAHPDCDELAGQCCGKRTAIGGSEGEGEDAPALRSDACDHQRTEARPGRRRAGRGGRQARIASRISC